MVEYPRLSPSSHAPYTNCVWNDQLSSPLQSRKEREGLRLLFFASFASCAVGNVALTMGNRYYSWRGLRVAGAAMPFTTSEQRRIIAVQTPDIEMEFSLDDGGLRSLRRAGGPNVLGYGAPRPSVDVQLGVAGEWLADRIFVRYLRHTIEERDGAVELAIVIGVGPLIVYDRYRITGTLIARRVSVVNVGEDEI